MKNNLGNFAGFASIRHIVVQTTDFKPFLNLCHPSYSHQFSWNKTLFLIIVHILTSVNNMLTDFLLAWPISYYKRGVGVFNRNSIFVYFNFYGIICWLEWLDALLSDVYTFTHLEVFCCVCKIDFFIIIIICCCSLIAKLCPPHCDPMDCSTTGSSVQGIF